MEWKDDSKHTTGGHADTNLANYARDMADALQTMLQINNTTAEDKA